mgnify:FL=1
MAENTENYNLEKPAGNDTVDINVFNNNFDIIDTELSKRAELVDGKVPTEQLPEMDYLSPTGEGKDVTVTFSEAGSRANIATGEKLSVLFGKIKKYFSDLKAVAFSGSYNDLSNKPTSLPANGGTSAACTGNAATATKLQTARAINGVSFDGQQNITIADSTKAPTNHASTGTTYGVGNASSYGHVKVRNDLVGTETSGATVSPAQIKTLSEKLQKVSTPGRGSVIYTGEVIKGGTLTKNIPIGADCTNATMYFKSNDTSLQGIGVVKITDLNHTYGYAGGYTPAHSDYGAERILPAIENFFGTKGIELKEAYITGTNLRIVFNNVGEYSFNLNCKVLWEAW